jgi:hypothetical protein
MATHKLDQLFKKKLNKHTSVPSVDAWARVEANLEQSSKKPIWIFYRVAAAVLFIVISGVVLYNYQNTEEKQVADVEVNETPKIAQESIRPKLQKSEIQTPTLIEEEVQKEVKQIIESKPKETFLAQNDTKNVEESSQIDIKEVVILDLPEENLIAMEDAKSHIENKAFKVNNVVLPKQKENKPRPKVKIIYKRGKKTQPQAMLAKNDTTSKKKFNFNSIIDATKHITSGDLIADMRDAKDDFLSRGFDFNKSKNVKNKNSNK